MLVTGCRNTPQPALGDFAKTTSPEETNWDTAVKFKWHMLSRVSREAWTRRACDVSVRDAGLGQRQSRRLGTAPLRGVTPWPGRDVVLLFRQRAAILGVLKSVRLECQTLRSLMLA